MGELYKLTCLVTGREYIGITTKTAKRRWRGHNDGARHGGGCKALNAAIRKYGPQNFRLLVLATSEDWRSLCRMEKNAIRQFKTRAPHGYNLTAGGEGTIDPTPEARAAIAASKRAFWKDPARRAEAAEALRQRHRSDEQYRKLMRRVSATQWNDPVFQQKMAEAQRVRWQNPYDHKALSDRNKNAWADGDYRKRMSARLRQNSEALRHRVLSQDELVARARRTRALWATPEYRARVMAARKKHDHAKAARAIWQRPGYREKMSAAFKKRKGGR